MSAPGSVELHQPQRVGTEHTEEQRDDFWDKSAFVSCMGDIFSYFQTKFFKACITERCVSYTNMEELIFEKGFAKFKSREYISSITADIFRM